MLDVIEELMHKGVELHKSGKVEVAAQLYSVVLKEHPEHPDANHNMGVLAVGIGKIPEALRFFETALEANADVAQFWVSYIDALIGAGRMGDAQAVLDQAKSNGARGEGFDQLEARLNVSAQGQLMTCSAASEAHPQKPNILDSLKLDQAIRLAKKKSKEDTGEEAKRIYQDILIKFPKNKRAMEGLKALVGTRVGKASKVQDPPQEQQQLLISLYNERQFIQVLEQITVLLEMFPNSSFLHNISGAVYKGLGHLDTSIEAYKKALALKPDSAVAFYNMGNVLKERGKLEEAIEAYNKALVFNPDYADAHNNIGNALQDQSKLEEAISAFKKALSLKPNCAEAYCNIGNAFAAQGNLEEAIIAYRKSLSINPDSVVAHSHMAAVFADQGKLEEAIEAYSKALAINPDYGDAHNGLGFALLNAGELKRGLDEYEWRWKSTKYISSKRHFSQPLWDGQKSLQNKKILLWCEQGVGDTINWASCLPLVTSQAKHCIVECQEKLVPLLSRSFPNVEVKPENRSLDTERNDFDYHLPMGSLYRSFASEVSRKAKADAFLFPDPVRINFWRKRLISMGKGPYVGISWKSANMSAKRLPNYASTSDLSPVLTLPGVTFINLQYVDFADDLSKIQNELGVTVHHFDDLDHYNDLLEVAALCAALDIIVSTTSAVPFISAGVGTLTKFASWKQSPWSNNLFNPVGPSVDKFERNTWQSWHNVFHLIAEDILKLSDDWSHQ
jgi:tetratricopeptide (TPR) repeat protein